MASGIWRAKKLPLFDLPMLPPRRMESVSIILMLRLRLLIGMRAGYLRLKMRMPHFPSVGRGRPDLGVGYDGFGPLWVLEGAVLIRVLAVFSSAVEISAASPVGWLGARTRGWCCATRLESGFKLDWTES